MLKFLIITVLPITLLLLYINKKDKEKPEPRNKLAACFGLGMLGGLVGSLISGIFNWLGIGWGYNSVLFGDIISNGIISILAVSIVYLILWKYSEKNPDFDEFFDGPVYAVFILFGYQLIYDLFNVGSDEWYMIGLLSATGYVVLYVMALIIGHYFSLAFFKQMELTGWNKFKMWIIPVAIMWFYNVTVNWLNSTVIGSIFAFLFCVAFAYFAYKKNNSIVAELTEKDLDEANIEKGPLSDYVE